VPGGEQVHQPVLDLVGVLEFVNENIVETLAILLQHIRMIFEEPDHLHQQITKVERIGLLQALLVKSVDASDLFRLVITVIKLVRPDTTIFGPVDRASHRPRFEGLIVDTEFLQNDFEQTFLILIIVDRKIAIETESLDFLAQNPYTGRMKGADQSPLGSPSSSSRRSLISPAALLVKVTARICQGSTLYCVISQAIRCVRARVLPEPAPASNSSGPVSCLTASCCIGLSCVSRSVTLVPCKS